MSVFWGMFAYSIATLAIVTGLAIKLALLYRDCGELRLKVHSAEREAHDTGIALKGLESQMKRYRKEIEVLREELDQNDDDLDTVGVADRLEQLLSGEVRKDSDEGGESGDTVSTSSGSNPKSSEV